MQNLWCQLTLLVAQLCVSLQDDSQSVTCNNVRIMDAVTRRNQRRGAATEGEVREKGDGWTEISTGQSQRVWTDQRREAEIGSFWLEENRKEEWPTAAWGQVIGREKTKQKKQQTNRSPSARRDVYILNHVTSARSSGCWWVSVTQAALHIPSASELPIGSVYVLGMWTVKEAELHAVFLPQHSLLSVYGSELMRTN